MFLLLQLVSRCVRVATSPVAGAVVRWVSAPAPLRALHRTGLRPPPLRSAPPRHVRSPGTHQRARLAYVCLSPVSGRPGSLPAMNINRLQWSSRLHVSAAAMLLLGSAAYTGWARISVTISNARSVYLLFQVWTYFVKIRKPTVCQKCRRKN